MELSEIIAFLLFYQYIPIFFPVGTFPAMNLCGRKSVEYVYPFYMDMMMKLKHIDKLDGINPMTGRRILIIEDNTYVREAFELTLKSSGLDAMVVTTAEEGMDAVRHESFDVIISDYRLPGMTGLDFFTLARPFTTCTKKVLISAYGFDEIGLDAKSIGVDHLIIKPFSIQQLLYRLNLDDRCYEDHCDSTVEI